MIGTEPLPYLWDYTASLLTEERPAEMAQLLLCYSYWINAFPDIFQNTISKQMNWKENKQLVASFRVLSKTTFIIMFQPISNPNLSSHILPMWHTGTRVECVDFSMCSPIPIPILNVYFFEQLLLPTSRLILPVICYHSY